MKRLLLFGLPVLAVFVALCIFAPWVLLWLLALTLLLLFVPSVLKIDYRKGQLLVKLRVLFITLRLYPLPGWLQKRMQRSKKEEPEEEEKEKKPKKEKPEKTLEQRLDFVKRVLSSAGRAMDFITRHTRFRDVEFAAIVNLGEAADTAVWYGRLHAALGSVVAQAQERLNIRLKRCELYPDFADEYEYSLLFACKVSAAPVVLLAAAVLAVKQFIQYNKPPVQGAAQPKPKEL